MPITRPLTVLLFCLCLGSAAAAQPAAEVAFLSGTAQALAADGVPRALAEGDAVHAGETLITGPAGYLDLEFVDGGRMLLKPGTEFRIERFRFTPPPAAPAGGSGPVSAPAQADAAFFRLLKGAFRAVSGLIGKADQSAYGVETPVATIGIRGTEYEARLCAADCAETPGLYAAVDEGAIALINQAGEFRLRAGEFAHVPGRREAVRRLSERPRALIREELKDLDSPRFERLKKRYRLLRFIQREKLRRVLRERR